MYSGTKQGLWVKIYHARGMTALPEEEVRGATTVEGVMLLRPDLRHLKPYDTEQVLACGVKAPDGSWELYDTPFEARSAHEMLYGEAVPPD